MHIAHIYLMNYLPMEDLCRVCKNFLRILWKWINIFFSVVKIINFLKRLTFIWVYFSYLIQLGWSSPKKKYIKLYSTIYCTITIIIVITIMNITIIVFFLSQSTYNRFTTKKSNKDHSKKASLPNTIQTKQKIQYTEL